jgi:hypothetical protein
MKLKDFNNKISIKDNSKDLPRYSYLETENKRRLEKFEDSKKKNTEYFRIHKLSLSFSLGTISLRCDLKIWPFYKRGTRGVLLDPGCINHFCADKQKVIEESLSKGCSIVIIKDMMFTLPKDYFKIVNNKH